MSIRKNTLWNLLGSGLPLVAAVLLIPYTLKTAGNEVFGILTLIWALIGYFSLFDLGVGRSLTYEISKLHAVNSHKDINPILTTGLTLTLLTGVLGTFVLWFISPILVINWLKISFIHQADAILAFKICALAIIPTTVTSGLRGALEGFQRFAASNLSKLIIGLSMFALPAFSLNIHGVSLTAIAAYLCVMRLVVALFACWQMREYLQKTSQVFAKQHFNKLFNYGFWVTITGIVGPLMVYGDRFFVSAIVGANTLPFYAIPQEGLFRLLMIPSAFCGALMPQLASQRPSEIVANYKKNHKKLSLIMLGICVAASLLIYPVLLFWISPDFADKSILIALLLVVGVWLNSISMMPYTLLQARGNPKLTAIFHIIELCIYIPVLWILIKNFGLIGAAIAWIIRVLLDYLLLQTSATKLVKTYEQY